MGEQTRFLVDGYPNKIKRISKSAQLVDLIDCNESLTKDDRPYRKALDSLKALTMRQFFSILFINDVSIPGIGSLSKFSLG